jgi:predicted phage terminase large subunit-like protein|tara:strand:+ start:153 stop:1412 length:1260 start_codon:yes stop_codon:yes gene_type:complete
MAELNVKLLKWQQEVFSDDTRFKVVAAGRRCGKTREAAWEMIIRALKTPKVEIFYVAPTQGQARDIMWTIMEDLAHPVITHKHVNNMQFKLVNGSRISLKGADRPDTMRGVSLEYLVMDEYADMKPQVWEEVLRPALADRRGGALFIGTPKGRNHFYDLFLYADKGEDESYKAWHFTSYDNETLSNEEIDLAKKSMSSYAFRQEFLASFEALGSEIFKEEWVKFDKEEPRIGDYYIAIDLAGFTDNSSTGKRNKRLDNTAISVVKVNEDGWYIQDIIYGRWTLEETANKIFNAVDRYKPISVGIERGIAKQAVMSPLTDLMKRRSRFFRVEELTHGNKNKTDRVVWALQGRFENGYVTVNKGEWNSEFLDQLFQFPNPLVHDDLVDSLAYIDQLAKVAYHTDWIDDEDDYQPLDILAGY